MTVNQAKNAPGPNNDNEPGRLKNTKRRMRKSPTGPATIPALAGEDMPPQVRSEVMKLVDELDRLKDELVAANERVSELEDMADEDPLVPVLNRRGFERELERTLAYVKRYKTPVTLVYLDLDDFKGVNDRHGHAGGDAALKHFAQVLLANVRRSDLVGRIGGDEFAIVLHHADDSAATLKAEQLTQQIDGERVAFQGQEIRIGVTAGATGLRPDDTVQTLLERADRAMYEGKAKRRAQRAAATG